MLLDDPLDFEEDHTSSPPRGQPSGSTPCSPFPLPLRIHSAPVFFRWERFGRRHVDGRRLSGWMIFYWITLKPVRMSSKMLVVSLSMAPKDIIQTTKTSNSERRRLIFADLLRSVRNRQKRWMLEMMCPNGVRKFSSARSPPQF